MIRRLRAKLILITMGTLLIVFIVIFLMLNLFMRQSSSRQTDELLETLAGQDGLALPPMQGGQAPNFEGDKRMMNPDFMRASRFFYVKVGSDGAALETHVAMMFDFTESEAQDYAAAVLERGSAKGTVDAYQYLVAEKDYGHIVVFAERSIETRMLEQLMQISLWVAAVTMVVLFAFSLLISRWAVAPVKAAFERQRRFVSDASHELKTPLTTISANTDVLENEIGENQRLSDIRSQTERMGLLIHDLISLARADEGEAGRVMAQFDLSRCVLGATLEFESRAFEEGRTLEYEVAPDISYTGDEQQIKQLCGILLDNAIKYSGPGGKIRLNLTRDGGKVRLAVFNTGEGISEAERDKIFDRFYRTDTSRSRETGGYGLGLAIAKSIVELHKGAISVGGRSGEGTLFTVTL